MTLDDLGGHSPNAGLIKCNSTNICATFSTVLTDTPPASRGPSAIAKLLITFHRETLRAQYCRTLTCVIAAFVYVQSAWAPKCINGSRDPDHAHFRDDLSSADWNLLLLTYRPNLKFLTPVTNI